MSALDRLVQDGKVRYLGASNFPGWHLQKAIDLSRQMGWEPFVCLQPLYNLLERGIEWEILPVCRNEGVGVIPWSPLRGGWLSGKFRRGMSAPPAGSRVKKAEEEGWSESWSAYDNERTWSIVDTLTAVAEQAGKSPSQVAINWLLQRPEVTAPIVGARTIEQLETNLGAAGWSLSMEHMTRLNEVSEMPPTEPYAFISRWRRT